MSEGEPRQVSRMDINPADPTKVGSLDDWLKDMIYGVYAACDIGRAHLEDSDPSKLDGALNSATEILNTVMAGNVEEWIR